MRACYAVLIGAKDGGCSGSDSELVDGYVHLSVSWRVTQLELGKDR
jgi:hypothetical protein